MSDGEEEIISCVVNLTPHTITIYRDHPSYYNHHSKCPQFTVKPSGTVARCTEKRELIKKLHIYDQGNINISQVRYGDVVGSAEPRPETIFIVSMMVAQAAPHRRDFYYPGELVRDEDGVIVGCFGLSQV